MKRFIKNNLKTILAVSITAIICIAGTAFASYQYQASQIEYKEGKSVKQALNDLYSKINYENSNLELLYTNDTTTTAKDSNIVLSKECNTILVECKDEENSYYSYLKKGTDGGAGYQFSVNGGFYERFRQIVFSSDGKTITFGSSKQIYLNGGVVSTDCPGELYCKNIYKVN